MRVILLVICFFVFNKSNASLSDTLLSKNITVKDTLAIKIEYSGCKWLTQKEVMWYYDGSKINILFFDSIEIKLLPKGNLSNEKRKVADRILKKYECGQKLNSKEMNYATVKLNEKNSLFDFTIQYLKKDTVYIKTNFESAKEKFISFERMLKKRREGDKYLCIANAGNCRTKVTLASNCVKGNYEYYSDGCNDVNELLKEYFK